MDPKDNLKQQAMLAKKITAIVDGISDTDGPTIAQQEFLKVFAERLAELSTAYCEWIQKGGFPS
jgi:hypothetical protein